VAKNGRKVMAIVLLFYNFLPLFQKYVAKNGRKVKAIALFFCHFVPLFQK
jgi:hypothetical protein